MDAKLEQYLFKAKTAQNKKRDNHLIDLGLYDKVYSPDGKYSEEYHFTEYIGSEKKYYKTVPIKITDDEYNQILETENTKSRNNGIVTALTIISIFIYFGGFVLGFSVIEDDFTYTVIWWISTLVSGTIMLGFSQIIKLLDVISKK